MWLLSDYACAMKISGFVLLLQRFQRTREFSREECLVATPGRDAEIAGVASSCTPRRTPRRAATPRRTPRSAARFNRTPGSRELRTPEASVRGVKAGRGRRQLVRMAALRSPFSSPNTENQRMWVISDSLWFFFSLCVSNLFYWVFVLLLTTFRKFDEDLESVSRGIRRLKHLSKAFDEIIKREDR